MICLDFRIHFGKKNINFCKQQFDGISETVKRTQMPFEDSLNSFAFGRQIYAQSKY